MPASIGFPIIVNSSSPITINIQIAEQIKLLIAVGKLRPGNSLPTVTKLAKSIGVNHNTIAAVYNYLIESGYLVAQRGKGTFVSHAQTVQDIITRKELYNLLSQAYKVAAMIGLSPSEFAGAAYAQAMMLNQQTTEPLQLAFIDSRSSVNTYEAVQTEVKEHLLFIYLEDLKANQSKALKALRAADLVITTVHLLWEVTQVTQNEQEVIGVDIKPDLQIITQISSLPRNAITLIVSQRETESDKIKQILQHAGVSHIKFQVLGLDNIKQNLQLLHQASVICVSKDVEEDVRQYSSQQSKIAILNFSLNETNASVLKARLSAIKVAKSSSYNNQFVK